ncbi:MAG: class I SAM-dependent methyltransferase [Flavobacteriales bacterium]|nr:class I SAM-dependent methyltransferase [Flavobacteriales bacterium]
MRGKYRIIRKLHPHGKVLDVGCGTGSFLAHLMSRGYIVQGVEPDLKARENAIAELGVPVVPSLEQVPGLEQFQIVTLWHVLEHLPDLRSALKRIYAQLADQGVLVIAVPDRDSWDATHYGTFWAAWDVPRHFHHFRQQDVHALLREHGFELIQTKRMWMDAPYIAILSEGYAGAPKVLALVRGLFIGAWSNVASLVTGRPTSSSLYLARKAKA